MNRSVIVALLIMTASVVTGLTLGVFLPRWEDNSSASGNVEAGGSGGAGENGSGTSDLGNGGAQNSSGSTENGSVTEGDDVAIKTLNNSSKIYLQVVDNSIPGGMYTIHIDGKAMTANVVHYTSAVSEDGGWLPNHSYAYGAELPKKSLAIVHELLQKEAQVLKIGSKDEYDFYFDGDSYEKRAKMKDFPTEAMWLEGLAMMLTRFAKREIGEQQLYEDLSTLRAMANAE